MSPIVVNAAADAEPELTPDTDLPRPQGDAPTTRSYREIGGRRRIDRRLDPLSAPGSPPPDDLVVEFRDRYGKVSQRFDFEKLGLPPDVAALLADAFRHHLTPLASATRKHYWKELRPFARFANTDGAVASLADVTSEMVLHFRAWLFAQTTSDKGTPWSQRSVASALGVLRQLINAAKRLHRSRLPESISFPSSLVSRRKRARPRDRLNEEALKALVGHCQVEIDEAMERFARGQALLDGSASAVHDVRLRQLLRTLVRISADGFPSESNLKAQGVGGTSIHNSGGLRHLLSYLFLTSDTVAPFFVALLAELTSNVEPTLALPRDCCSPQPLLADRRIIEWEKPRAGRADERLQWRSFGTTLQGPDPDRPPVELPYAPPKLVDKLLQLTQPLVPLVQPQDRNRLFLVPMERPQTIGPISLKSMTGAVRRLRFRANAAIAQWNRANPQQAKPPIPAFALMDLRPSAATAHHHASGGDILRTQRQLNHAHPDTTIGYIEGPETDRRREKAIADLQDLWIARLQGNEHQDQPTISTPLQGGPVSASIGHLCRNPVIAETASDRQRLCPNFHKCLKCPGLHVFHDADHLARMLQFKEALEVARKDFHHARWDLLLPTYRAVKEILAQFPDRLFPEARELLQGLPPVPELE